MLLNPTFSPARVRRPRPVTGILAALALLAVTVWGASTAQAHSELLSVSPMDGARLDVAPTQVVLTFSANVIGDFTQVEVRRGEAPIALTAPVSAANTVTQALPADLGAGTYTVTFRIVSADSHPVGGQSSFSVTSPSAAPTPSASGSPSSSTSPAQSAPSSSPASSAPEPTMSALSGDDAAKAPAPTSGSPWRWIALGVVAVLALAAAVLSGRKRPRRGPDDHVNDPR